MFVFKKISYYGEFFLCSSINYTYMGGGINGGDGSVSQDE
jgi:hypothetical protein